MYLCINKDRINLYKLPLTSTPFRQFIYDCEQVNSGVDEKDKSVLRLQINQKEYVFKLKNTDEAQDWSYYINKAAKAKDVKIQKVRGKTWRSPHITKARFLKEANTFDILKFKDNGETTYGIMLQTIDMDASKELLYNHYPEILHFNHKVKKMLISPIEEVLIDREVSIIPLVGFECEEYILQDVQKFIKREVRISTIHLFNTSENSY